jgi:tetratricopeptide (TPR) repeat protein
VKFSSGEFLVGPVPHDRAGLCRDIEQCEQILGALGQVSEGDAAAERGVVLWRLGEDLLRLERFAAAADRFGQAAEILGGVAQFAPLRDIELQAHFRQGTVYAHLGRNEQALRALEIVVRAITPDIAEDGALGTVAASAVSLWLSVLEGLGYAAKADVAAQEIAVRFGSGATELHRLLTTTAFASRGSIALSAGNHEQALVFFDDVLRRSSGEYGSEFRQLRDEVGVKRARALEQAGRGDEALAAYHDCLLPREVPEVVSRPEALATKDAVGEARLGIKRLKRAGYGR